MRLWRVILLVNLALAVGLLLGFLAWGRPLDDTRRELAELRGQAVPAGVERVLRARGVVRAIVPEAELYKYSTTLHSITHGRGTHREKFHGYAEAPPEVAAKVAAENQKEHAVAS